MKTNIKLLLAVVVVLITTLMFSTSMVLAKQNQEVAYRNLLEDFVELEGGTQGEYSSFESLPIESESLETSNFKWIAIFAISAMVINSIGIFVIYKHKDWALANKEHFMCFAAGMLIASSLMVALPEAVSESKWAGLAALVGFIFMYFSSRIAQKVTNSKEAAFGVTALEGIGIHSFMDGVIYSVTFSHSVSTGILAGIGLVVHEFAEGVVTFSLLIKAGVDKKKAAASAFFVAALTTPIGAFISYPLIKRWTGSITGLALGFTAGVLVYISASHLLPEAESGNKKHSYVSMLAGVSLAVILMFIGV